MMPHEYEYDHLLHPTTLDGVFQTFFSAIKSSHGIVPTSIDSLFVSAELPKGPGSEFCGFTRATRKGFRHFGGRFVMSDENWSQPKIVVNGLLGTELGASSSESDTLQDSTANIRKLCSTLSWKEDVDHLTQDNVQTALRPTKNATPMSKEIVADYNQAARIYMLKALSSLDPTTEAAMAPHLVHFVQWMRRRVELTNAGSIDTGAEETISLLSDITTWGIDGSLLSAIGQSLGGILDGSNPLTNWNEKLFSEYRAHSIGLQAANSAMMKWLDLQAHKRPGLNYLEIGAGKGSISLPALEVLGGQQTPRLNQYTFTDSNPDYFEDAQKDLKSWQNRLQYKKLDIDRDPSEQGFEAASIDVIIAGNASSTMSSHFHNESNTYNRYSTRQRISLKASPIAIGY